MSNFDTAPGQIPAVFAVDVTAGAVCSFRGLLGVATAAATAGNTATLGDGGIASVPAGTHRGDYLYVAGSPPFAEGPLALTLTATNNTPVARALADRDAGGHAPVLLLRVAAGALGPVLLGTFDYTEATADGVKKSLATIPAGTLVRDFLTINTIPFDVTGALTTGFHLDNIGGQQYAVDNIDPSAAGGASFTGQSAVAQGSTTFPQIAATDLVFQVKWLNNGQGTSWSAQILDAADNEDESGGTWTLSFNGITTAPIAYNAADATVLAAMKAAFGAGNVVSVVGNGGLQNGSYAVTFVAAFQPTTAVVANFAGITGPHAPYIGSAQVHGVVPKAGRTTFYRL